MSKWFLRLSWGKDRQPVRLIRGYWPAMLLLATFGQLLLAACGDNTATPAVTAPTTAAAAAPAAVATNQFQGVEVNVLTFTGPQIAEPLQRRAPDFAKLTGAKVNIITVPFSDLYQKILTDVSTKTNSFNAFVLDPQW